MKKLIMKMISILIILLLINGCSQNITNNISKKMDKQKEINISQTKGSQNTHTKGTQKTTLPPKIDPIKEQLKKMTLNEKIGQMIIAGFDGTTVNTNTQTLINKYKVGGLILYQTNVKDAAQLVHLTNAIKTANSKNKVPLFISVDQEGGRVHRMPTSIKNTPSARIIGNKNDEKYAYNIGNVIAYELKSFGFNTDFAPVLDIQSNPNNAVIGDRSFGSNSSIVSRLGVSMMKGISSGNIIPVVKHFPGHGDTSVDSHLELPLVRNNLTRLEKVELVPFNNAFKNHADMVMVAHILVQKIDPNYPASMSKAIITNLLRKQYGFGGVVISDDMTMGAIAKHYKLKDAAVRAVNAGSDIILVGHGMDNVATVYNSIYSAVKNHTISEDTINNSLYRILTLKHKYNLNNNKVSLVNVSNLNNQITKAISNASVPATNSTKNKLLINIRTKAKVGSIINADFHIKSTTIDEVRKSWGKEDKREYVAAAKGTYCTYSKKNVVVAYNKGQQLFEIRSYDPSLKALTIQDIKYYFGSPKTDVKTTNKEEIISYTVGTNTLKFVFPLGTQKMYLDHYSIYNASLASNNMAG
ncbi:beta-N-acetylhexosaminidase [Bacillus sp. sid0103]|uniref:beta-N-acetylhexosaminidase n=1 Tax=Bacillus sp. sid0103 TaxID=2856337 RepID=UPI001C445B4A|nr:beta-N-acetylhexosaminidase [Bacillus sp. sid0103]MBV7505277.1 beta-N-acetylhexosaminidase [Bacillus sp. sid0103]